MKIEECDWERLRSGFLAAFASKGKWPWEVTLLDGDVTIEARPPLVLQACACLYAVSVGGDDYAGVLSFYTLDETTAITDAELVRRVLETVPSMQLLYREGVQTEGLATAGVFAFQSDEQGTRNQEVLARAVELCDQTRLPAVVAGIAVDGAGEERIMFMGLRGLPLHELRELLLNALQHSQM